MLRSREKHAIPYKPKSPSPKASVGKEVGWKVIVATGVAVVGFFTALRWGFSVPESESRSLPSPNLQPLSCNEENLLSMSYRPGQLSLITPLEGVSLLYPYEDSVKELSVTQSSDQPEYLKAVRWLNIRLSEKTITDFSEGEFIELLKSLHRKITFKQKTGELDYRSTFIYVSKNKNLHLFDLAADFSSTLDATQINVLNSIKIKVGSFIKRFIDTDFFSQDKLNDLHETIALELTDKGMIKGIEGLPEESQLAAKECELSAEEKYFIREFYDIKPERSIQSMESEIQTKFRDIIQVYKNNLDAIKLAAHIHMLIVDIHPFTDGNGRSARLLLNSIRKAFGEPMVVFPHEQDYMDMVYHSITEGDYEIFETYINELASKNHDHQRLEIACNYLSENNCQDPQTKEKYIACFTYMQKMQDKEERFKTLQHYRDAKGERKREIFKKYK